MKKMSRMLKSGKEVKAPARRADLYRRFIPDARPATPQAARGAFWQRIWLSLR